MNPFQAILGLFSPAGAKGGGAAVPSIATPISSGATSALNSSGSSYQLESGSPINFAPSPSTYLIIAAAGIIGLLIWKGKI